jgi:hypothetical protein
MEGTIESRDIEQTQYALGYFQLAIALVLRLSLAEGTE